jgi:membrane-bound metal-dependent hydrolase YbcI (DUF457 family)
LVEPLLHFAVPFASLRAFGLDLRKVLFASLVALTPDLDLLFQVHRSESHSFVLLSLITLPLLVLTWNRKSLRSVVLLGAFGISTHLVLDLFQAPTPVLWPLVNESMWIPVTLDLHMGSALVVTGSVTVHVEPMAVERFTSFDAPVLTGEGLGVSAVLFAPTLVQILLKRLTATG